jgi:hypothetical protein
VDVERGCRVCPTGAPRNGYGRRIAKKRDGNLVQGFLYGEEALEPVAELDSAGNVDSRFVYAIRPNVPDYMTGRQHLPDLHRPAR